MDRKSDYTPFLLCLLIFLTVQLSSSFCLAAEVTLGWNPNEESNLAGYMIYRNIGSHGPPYKYDDTLPEDDLANPLDPKVIITGLKENTKYYIALTAYDTQGNESKYSDEICVQIIDSVADECSYSTSESSKGGGGGGGGGGCFVSAADQKVSWLMREAFFLLQQAEAFLSILLLLLIAGAKLVWKKVNNDKEIRKKRHHLQI